MKSKYNKCQIFKDLIPMYIDNLASIETKQYIEEHIKECARCKRVLKQIKIKNNI